MSESLQEYNQKRRFGKTAEPRGTAKKAAKQLHFVVQHHIASRDHYDFRLEWDGVLKSWAVPKGPSYNSRDKRLAVQVEDHPLDYRSFEGTIPKGEYGGGTVMVWDEGTWQPQKGNEPDEALANGSLKFTLQGSRLKGNWALVRMKPKPGEKDNNWLLIKEKDEYTNKYDIHLFDRSIQTGRTMEEIGEGKAAQQRPPFGQGTAAMRVLKNYGITSADKVLYRESGVTKGDVAVYYSKVASRMLPYIQNRIISAVRCPRGVESACFFKKHPAEKAAKGIVTIPVPSNKGKEEDYFYIANTNGLMWEVQMNTLEFHTWASSAQKLEMPDVMVFDLDPDEGLDLESIRQGVRDLKGMLDELELVSYLKTSGGKGYHVVIPFKPAAGWDSFYGFAKNIAKTMEARWPDRYTSNVRKNQRQNRIFIDWLRNGRGATSVAPYSVRAREGAPVSMPLAWKELDTVTPQGISMEEAVRRLRSKDPWQGFFDTEQLLK